METSDGEVQAVPLVPDRAVGEVTRDLLKAVAEVAGEALPNVFRKVVIHAGFEARPRKPGAG